MVSHLALVGLAAASLSYVSAYEPVARASNSSSYNHTCGLIAAAISNASDVYYPGSVGYANDIAHWLGTSSQNSTCSVEPGNAADVSRILKVLGRVDTPFAVKSAGHALSLGFSSTLGVQIALSRFNGISYDANSSSVTIGIAKTWDQVYDFLQPYNVTVSGGRIVGVGVGGFLLGGGYSWLTNQYGLAMDTVLSYNVVLPNGTITRASNSFNQDLFWGLKGGYNNYGIVTEVTIKSYPLGTNGLVWGGLASYSGDSIPLVINAMVQFSAMQSGSSPIPKGNCGLRYKVAYGSAPVATLETFYDGAVPPDALFGMFKGIPTVSDNQMTQTYTDFVTAVSDSYVIPSGARGTGTTVGFHNITASIINKSFAALNATVSSGAVGAASGTVVIEPFIPSAIYRPFSDGVFPHAVFSAPTGLQFGWGNPAQDTQALAALSALSANITATLRAEGQPVDAMMLYPNYAVNTTSIESMYGPNLAKAKALRAQIDKQGVMLRASGFKLA